MVKDSHNDYPPPLNKIQKRSYGWCTYEDVLKFSKFSYLITLQGCRPATLLKTTLVRVFSYEFCKISSICLVYLFAEYLRLTAFNYVSYLHLLLSFSATSLVQFCFWHFSRISKCLCSKFQNIDGVKTFYTLFSQKP